MATRTDRLFEDLTEEFGKSAVVRGADIEKQALMRIPTGIFAIDYLTLGGLPAMKCSMFWGHDGSGKTTLAALAVKSYQQLCSRCFLPLDRATAALPCRCKKPPQLRTIYMDAENSLPLRTVQACEVDRTRFDVVRPETSEQAIDMIERILRDEDVGLFILDSIGAMVPMVEIEKSADEWQQGYIAREINKACRKITGAMISRAKKGIAPTVILINQTRADLGIRYGDNARPPGGNGQNFLSRLSIKTWAKGLERGEKDNLKPGEVPSQIRV